MDISERSSLPFDGYSRVIMEGGKAPRIDA